MDAISSADSTSSAARFGLLLAARERRELHQDFGAHDRGVLVRVLDTAEHREERAIGALGALELPVVSRELGEGAEDLRVRRVDSRGGVELHERLGSVAEREVEPCELVVDGRALFRPASAEPVDERAKDGARLCVAPGGSERVRERETQRAVLRIQIARLLEQGYRLRRCLALAAVKLGGLSKRGESRGLVTGMARRLREQVCELAPLAS